MLHKDQDQDPSMNENPLGFVEKATFILKLCLVGHKILQLHV